jgi:hypothetical protein
MGRILLANSGQATNRANRDTRIAARGPPSSQSEIRLKFSATAVATCCRCAFASPRWRARRSPKDRTPCEIVPSMPARCAYTRRPAALQRTRFARR